MAVLAAMATCNPSESDSYPGQISNSFGDHKQLILVADYSLNAQAIGILSFADVAIGTPGTIEMMGPLHMHCDGTYQPMDTSHVSPGNRPSLDVGEGTVGAQLHAPAGAYTVVVAIPSAGASIRKTFHTSNSPSDAQTGVWDLPGGCLPVADTLQQLREMAVQYAGALVYWISRLDSSPVQRDLAQRALKARDQVLAMDYTNAVNTLSPIRSATSTVPQGAYYYRTYCSANSLIALLTQPLPPT